MGRAAGKQPIRCNDTPGFVVNRILIPLLNDCVRVLDEARVTPEDLDTAMKNGAGWPMGPCALVDLVGIDVHVHASEALHAQLREPRMAPPPRLVAMQQPGKLGRKSGRGFYVLTTRRSRSSSTRASARERAATASTSRPLDDHESSDDDEDDAVDALASSTPPRSANAASKIGTAPLRPPHMTNSRSPARRRAGRSSGADDERPRDERQDDREHDAVVARRRAETDS